jgi:death-on-curing protein
MTVWLSRQIILATHDEQLAEHGGAIGVRDEGLLESALARPLNRAGYGDPDIAELAALYAIAIARNHPFIDGNKRTALGACIVFLRLNGIEPRADGPEWEALVFAVAASTIDRGETTTRLRKLLPKPV